MLVLCYILYCSKISYNKSYIVNADFDVSNDQEKVIFADHESKLFLLINMLTNQVNDLSVAIDKKDLKYIKFAKSNHFANKNITLLKVNNDDLVIYTADFKPKNAEFCCLQQQCGQINIYSANQTLVQKATNICLSNTSFALACDTNNAVLLDLNSAKEILNFNTNQGENLFLSQNAKYLFRQIDNVIKIYTLPSKEEVNFYFNSQDFMNKTKKSKQDLAKILSSYLDNLANFTLTSTPQ